MGWEFSFDDHPLDHVYEDVRKVLLCAVEYGGNEKYCIEDRKTNKVFYSQYRGEHITFLLNELENVKEKALANVSRETHVFEDRREMEKYLRDVLITRSKCKFFDDVKLAIRTIPENKYEPMLRGLARYIRIFDDGQNSVVTQHEFEYFAEYLVNVLCWICMSFRRMYRSSDFWTAILKDYDWWNRDHFKNIPEYKSYEEKVLREWRMEWQNQIARRRCYLLRSRAAILRRGSE